jgi:hypothetical protein
LIRRTLLAVVALTTAGLLLPVPASAATIGQLIPAHSHWDVHDYRDHQVDICYMVTHPPADDAGNLIAFLPLREVDAKNFMQLEIRKTGFQLRKRIAGTFTTVTPSVAPPVMTLGTVGQLIMFRFTMVGDRYELYELHHGDQPGELHQGPLLGQWYDATYPTGVNISYYTQPKWAGKWNFVHGRPLDNTGQPHDIFQLVQDSRSHPSVRGEDTFDDPTPADGGSDGIAGTSSANFGLPHGPNYRFAITVSGSSTTPGTFDFRDPVSADVRYFVADFYRLTVASSSMRLTRYNGATAGQVWTVNIGGPGDYEIGTAGPVITVKKSDVTLLTVNDGGPQSGIRVRVRPGTQAWSWTGTRI